MPPYKQCLSGTAWIAPQAANYSLCVFLLSSFRLGPGLGNEPALGNKPRTGGADQAPLSFSRTRR